MAYFPKSIMPNILKRDAPGSLVGTMVAADFNRHTQAIIDIETFLGTGDASEQDIIDILSGQVAPKNFIGAVRYLADSMNVFINGITMTSGYIHSGQRMIFAENVQSAFLTARPEVSDKTINVNSTNGFPENGIISILNDVSAGTAGIADTSFVEWIRYSGKDSVSFQNCERAFLGSTAGTHAGNPPLSQAFTGQVNLRDQCVQLPIGYNICGRRYPGWRQKTVYAFPAYSISGTLVDLTRNIRRNPQAFPLDPIALKDSYTAISSAASAAGILATSPSGDPILKSSDSAAAAEGQLLWQEASTFVSSLISSGVISLLSSPGDWNVGNAPFVPVFQGTMSVSHAIAGITVNSSTSPSRLKSLGIEQSADGRLVVVSTTDVDQLPADEAIVQYKTFFVGSAVTSLERNM